LSLLAILAVFETSRTTLTGFRAIIGNRQAVKPIDEPFEFIIKERRRDVGGDQGDPHKKDGRSHLNEAVQDAAPDKQTALLA
jgi:hypothetical protein